MRTRSTLLIPSVALAAALASCGESGPSKSEFTAKADGSCAAGNTAISAVAKPSNGPQVATAAGTATTTIDGQVAALRAMKTPGGDDKKQIEGIVDAIAEVGGPGKALQDAAGKSDDAAMAKAAGDMQSRAADAATQAQAYGLTQCGAGLKPALANLFEGTKSVVKASFVSRAEGLCRDANRKTDAVPPPGNSGASTARFLDAVLGISTKLAADLKALPVPPGDEPTIAEIVSGLEAVNAKGKEASAAARANNPRLTGALFEEVDVASTALNAKFDAYGVKTCGTLS